MSPGKFWLFGWLLAVGAAGLALPLYSQTSEAKAPLSNRIANYEMDVRLDVENRLIDATEVLTWKNSTFSETSELQFHLYYNAWRNNKSSFLTSVRYRTRDWSDYRENDWAYCDVRSIKILPGDDWNALDLTSNMAFIQPDDRWQRGRPHRAARDPAEAY